MDIPNIGFNHDKSAQAELEILPLSNLYERDIISHDPQIPHRVSFYMIIYIEQGSGKHMVDFTQYSFEPNTLIFCNPTKCTRSILVNNQQGMLYCLRKHF